MEDEDDVLFFCSRERQMIFEDKIRQVEREREGKKSSSSKEDQLVLQRQKMSQQP